MPHYLVIRTESNWAYSIELESGETYRIGRAENNDINLKDAWASTYHARLSVEDGMVSVKDLESRNGVRVNGVRISGARLKHRDRIVIGNTEILYVTQLDPLTIGSQAYLSPKLSEPFMKTEVQKIASVSRTLSHVRDTLLSIAASANGSRDTINSGAGQLDIAIDRLRDIEEQARILVATNHFHEIFHTGTDQDSTLNAAVRFLTSAMEAENGALVLLRNKHWLVQAIAGSGLDAWDSGVPRQYQSLFEAASRGPRAVHFPDLGVATTMMEIPHGELFSGDNRSALVAGFHDSKGELAGVGYFDNISHPAWLKGESTGLATSCLAVVARYVLNDESVFGTHIARPMVGAGARSFTREQPVCEHTHF